jgi:PhzF family phenazine biosynthesis protein
MPRVMCWQVDAFADRPFRGNPAAVCWLEQDVSDGWMQAVAAEVNLSETAFVRKLAAGYQLRWFTPVIEVDLCGHATLASAHALWTAGIADSGQPLRFDTRSGVLTCTRDGKAASPVERVNMGRLYKVRTTNYRQIAIIG